MFSLSLRTLVMESSKLATRNSLLSFYDLAAPGVRALTPYAPGKPIAELEREYGVSEYHQAGLQ